jgi:periplasmic divalent cation tolerance protein
VPTIEYCEVRITCGSSDEAAAIADALVAERVVACAHVAPIASVYQWQGVVEHDDEVLLTAITRLDRCEAVAEMVASIHSYDLPSITWLAVGGSPAYLAWVDAQTS